MPEGSSNPQQSDVEQQQTLQSFDLIQSFPGHASH
jgi:hypothetical protein